MRQSQRQAAERAPAAVAGRGGGAAPRLYARAERILADEIAAGRLAAGTRLTESELARRFGISRAPVRQALAALAAAGLVARADGRGYVVLQAAGAVARDRAGGAAGPIEPGEPLAAAATWQGIQREIETAIVSRTAFASWRVVESELARAYGVSRTVARDVVARLNQRGIVRKDGKGRWIAPELTPAHVGELYEMRWVIEPAALVNAYPLIPKPAIAAALAHIEAAIAEGDRLDGAALDRLENELHHALIGHCANATMLATLRHCQSLLVAHSFLYDLMPQVFGVEPFLTEHRAVLERLAAGDVTAAAAALADHLRVSLDRSLARIDIVARHLKPEPLAYLQPLAEPP
jgi:DNA-binding GntR family transcriptional regulator